MKKLMALCTLLLAFSAPKAVQAFDNLDNLTEGLYIGAFGAADFPHVNRGHHSHHSSSSWSGSSERFHNRLKTGYFVSGSLGYRFCELQGFRVELEGGYHHNTHKKHHHHDSSNHFRRNHHGDANTWSILVNGLYDFETCWCVKPFLGAGIGYSSTHFKRSHHGHDSSSSCSDCGSHHHHKRRKHGFAWQLIAGLAYPLCDGWDISLQYRYFNPAVTRVHNNDVGIGLAYSF